MTVRTAAAPPTAAPGLDLVSGRVVRVPRVRGWLVFTAAVVAAFFVLIFSRTALDRTAFELQDLEARIAAEETRYWELRLDVARLQAPDRIMQLGEEMGLVYPAEIRPVTATGTQAGAGGAEDRWTELKALLSAQR